jgi:Uma2 family endonuclease
MAHALFERLEAEGKVDEALRYEILHGELVIRGAPLARHERVVRELLRHVANWVHEHGGEAFSGLAIGMGAHQLIPDLTFIGPDRVDQLDPDGFRVPPDVVAEVTSPGTRSLDLNEKRGIYAEIGVAEYWVVDLARDVVLVHRRDAAGSFQAAEHAEGTLTTPAAPGLAVPVAELFPQAPHGGTHS